MKKSILFGLVASLVGAAVAIGISFLYMNFFILFLLAGCIVGFAVRLTGYQGDNHLMIVGGGFSLISCLLALFFICLINSYDFMEVILDYNWISLLIAVGIGAYQAKNNEFIDDPQ